MQKLKAILDFFTDSVKDEDGRTSGMRLIAVVGVAYILLVWGHLSETKGVVQDVPQGLAMVVLALVGGKVWQAHIENH